MNSTCQTTSWIFKTVGVERRNVSKRASVTHRCTAPVRRRHEYSRRWVLNVATSVSVLLWLTDAQHLTDDIMNIQDGGRDTCRVSVMSLAWWVMSLTADNMTWWCRQRRLKVQRVIDLHLARLSHHTSTHIGTDVMISDLHIRWSSYCSVQLWSSYLPTYGLRIALILIQSTIKYVA